MATPRSDPKLSSKAPRLLTIYCIHKYTRQCRGSRSIIRLNDGIPILPVLAFQGANARPRPHLDERCPNRKPTAEKRPIILKNL
jgi:hypothetical protein